MARARNIKPGFFANEDLVELPYETRLLFIGLWTLADREGRLENRPKRIKMALFPADSMDVGCQISALQKCGFLRCYTSNGIDVIQIENFVKHQSPHGLEKDSELPDENGFYTVNERNKAKLITGVFKLVKSLDSVAEQLDNSSKTVLKPDQNALNPDSLNPDSLNPDSKKAPSAEFSQEFEDAWAAYPERPGASKKESFKAWNARIKAGANPEDMIQGVASYAAYVKGKKIEPEFIKQPVTFFGPAEHFKSDWRFTDSPNARASPHRESIAEKNERIMAAVMGNRVDDGMTIEMELGNG